MSSSPSLLPSLESLENRLLRGGYHRISTGLAPSGSLVIRPAGRATEHGLGVRPSQSYSSPNCQLEELGACSYKLFLTASFPLSESHLAEPLNRSVYKPSAALGRRPSIARPARCIYDYRPWSLRQKQVRIGIAKSTRNRLGYLNIHHRASTRACSSQTTSCLALVWS